MDMLTEFYADIENFLEKQNTVFKLIINDDLNKTNIMLSDLSAYLKKRNLITPIIISSITNIHNMNDLYLKIWNDLTPDQINNRINNITKLRCRAKISDYQKLNRSVVLFVEDLPKLFEQMRDDLPILRSLILNDQSLSIIGTGIDTNDCFDSLDEPFYRFFETLRLNND